MPSFRWSMCRVLMVHFSGFYAWLKEPLSQRALEDVRQTDLIQQAWTDSGKVYGYRKLHPSHGLQANHCRATDRPNMGIGGITPAMKLKMAA